MKKDAKTLIESLTTLLGETATTDNAISLMEDITDSVAEDTEDWKSKYEENDKAWRKRYTDRFMGTSSGEDDDPDPEPEPRKPRSFDSLFEQSEK